MENKSLPSEADQNSHDHPSASANNGPRQHLKAGFLMLTSAVLGGVAFALWNKRQIASMKEKSEDVARNPVPSADDDAVY
jgi:hypothetical protein